MNYLRNYCALTIISSLLMTPVISFAEKEQPSGEVTMEIKEIAIGVGGQSGRGVLTFQGENYPFKIKGMEVGSIGKVNIKSSGKVYNLEQPSDFEGIYFQAKASVTLGESGKAGVFLVNAHGVTMYIKNDSEGVDLTLGRGGIKIKFTKEVRKKIKKLKI